MTIPFSYTWRGLLQRKTSTMLTAGSFALVIFVLLALLSMVDGINRTLVGTGAADRLFVISKSATTENQSRLSDAEALTIESYPYVKLGPGGAPVASRELVATTNATVASGDRLQVNFRGVTLEASLRVHSGIRLVAGRFFTPDAEGEVALGKGVAAALGLAPGDTFDAYERAWRVVGLFEDDGSPFESEVWTSRPNMELAFKRDYVSSVWLLVRDPSMTDRFVGELNESRTVQVFATSEQDFFAEGAGMAKGLQILAWFVAAIMSVGAIFSAMNTMYASLADRTQELATMRAIGFPREAVLQSVLVESLVLALLGGALACLLAFFLNGITFRTLVPGIGMISFQFLVTPGLFATGVLVAFFLGVVGGWVPARHAISLPVVEALKS